MLLRIIIKILLEHKLSLIIFHGLDLIFCVEVEDLRGAKNLLGET